MTKPKNINIRLVEVAASVNSSSQEAPVFYLSTYVLEEQELITNVSQVFICNTWQKTFHTSLN